MKWLWGVLLVLLAVGVVAAGDWIPVESEIFFMAEISEGVEVGDYQIEVTNEEDVALKVSLGLNFESVPVVLGVEGHEIVTEFEGEEGAQYFIYFDLEPGAVEKLNVRYKRANIPFENFWEKEYSYNSPVTLLFDGEEGQVYYEVANYFGELIVDEIDNVECRNCLLEGGEISVSGSKDFSVQWSIQKVPVSPVIVYSIFAGFLLAFLIWEIQKWMIGGQGTAPE